VDRSARVIHQASSDTRATRLATRLAFWVAGFGVAAWAPLVPFAKQRLQVGDGQLGLLLLCLGIGSVLAMSRTGPLCARYGSKPVILAGGAGMVLLLPMLAVLSAPWAMAVALLGFGAALGSLDVAVNVHATEVERDADRPLMSGFHALFSVGGLAGSAVVTLMLSLSISPLAATLLCAGLMAAALGVGAPRLITGGAAGLASGGSFLALPRGPVVLLSALAAVTFLVEGALLDWSALLLTDTGLTSAERAGLGYVLFSVAMTAGRFLGDGITTRFGDRAVVFWGGLVVLLGFAWLLLVRRMDGALVAFVLIGLGAANVVPVLFRQAGRQRAMPPALAVSAVTTMGYAGYLLGPALLGFVSSRAGLPAAFWVLALLMCAVPIFARAATASRA
jgi:predicted MFS family arabinose efflux permease